MRTAPVAPLAGLLIGVILAIGSSTAHAQTLDDFESGANPQGWTGTYSGAGNPGGCLQRTTTIFNPFGGSTGMSTTTLGAPWRGDWRGAEVTELKIDLYDDFGGGSYTDIVITIWNQASGDSATFEYYSHPTGWTSLSMPIPGPGQPAAPEWVTYFLPGHTWEDLLEEVSHIEIAYFYWSWTGGNLFATARIDNVELLHAPGFHLYASDLNAAGTPSTLTALNGTEGGLVGFGASLSTGAATVNCAGAVLGSGLAAPQVLGVVSTDGYGHAHLAATAPAGLAGATVYVQALDLATCTLSNVATIALP